MRLRRYQLRGAAQYAQPHPYTTSESSYEVRAVQRTLRANHITITALHSHMTGESPRLLFMHFWAVDDAMVLARGLRAALATEAR